MLGQSAQENDVDVDMATVRTGAGLPHGELLVRFSDASAAADGDGGAALVEARQELLDTLGYQVMVDAAAVVANFNMMSRLADSMGSPLDDVDVEASEDFRDDLGVTGSLGNSVDGPTS